MVDQSGGGMKIEQRRQLYKRMVRGQEGLWDEYNKLRREVNLSIW